MATTNPLVSSLLPYVEQNAGELLTKSMLDGKARSLFQLMTGVKESSVAINIMDVDPQFTELSCGWNESGSTEFTQRMIDPAGLQVEMAFCAKNLLKSWAQHQVVVTAGKENLPFEEKWTGMIVDKINEKLENMIWYGQSAQTNQFCGILTTAQADDNVIDVTSSSAATAYAFLKDIAKAIPAKVKDAVILCSTPLYREYMQDLVAANLYHYDPANGENEYRLPGTDIKVIAVNGLNNLANDGKEYAVATRLSNLVWGISADGDEDTFDLFYEPSEREFRLVVSFCAGTNYAFSDEVVLGIRG